MTDAKHAGAEAKVGTTGHEWDGITELNTPLPRWWLWLFYATIVFAIGYWIVYPAWPLVSSSTNGVFGWHSRTAVAQELAALQTQRSAMTANGPSCRTRRWVSRVFSTCVTMAIGAISQ